MCGMCDFRSIHSIGSENSLQIQIVDNFFLFQQPKVIRNTTKNFDRISFCLLFFRLNIPTKCSIPNFYVWKSHCIWILWSEFWGVWDSQSVWDCLKVISLFHFKTLCPSPSTAENALCSPNNSYPNLICSGFSLEILSQDKPNSCWLVLLQCSLYAYLLALSVLIPFLLASWNWILKPWLSIRFRPMRIWIEL